MYLKKLETSITFKIWHMHKKFKALFSRLLQKPQRYLILKTCTTENSQKRPIKYSLKDLFNGLIETKPNVDSKPIQ